MTYTFKQMLLDIARAVVIGLIVGYLFYRAIKYLLL